MSEQKTRPTISSLAAPSDEDLAILCAMSEDERRAVVADHIAQGTRDIAEGRFTTLSSDADIRRFFDNIWPVG